MRLTRSSCLLMLDRSTCQPATMPRATLKRRAATCWIFSVERPAATLTFPTWSTCWRRRNEPTTMLCYWTTRSTCYIMMLHGLGVWCACVCLSVCLACCFCHSDAHVVLVDSTACCLALLSDWTLRASCLRPGGLCSLLLGQVWLLI